MDMDIWNQKILQIHEKTWKKYLTIPITYTTLHPGPRSIVSDKGMLKFISMFSYIFEGFLEGYIPIPIVDMSVSDISI